MAARKDKGDSARPSKPPQTEEVDAGWFDEDEPPTTLVPPRAPAKAKSTPPLKATGITSKQALPKVPPRPTGASAAPKPVATKPPSKPPSRAPAAASSKANAKPSSTPSSTGTPPGPGAERAAASLHQRRLTVEVQVDWLEPPSTPTIPVESDWLESDADEAPTKVMKPKPSDDDDDVPTRVARKSPRIPGPPPLPKDTATKKPTLPNGKPPSTPPRGKKTP